LEKVRHLTSLINPYEVIKWNIDKHYLRDLQDAGINIPPSLFIEKEDIRTLKELHDDIQWDHTVLKPVIAGGAWHTYRLQRHQLSVFEEIYRELISKESMILQVFQEKVMTFGEISLMLFNGRYSHAIKKRAKTGDFRVQDNFGDSVHHYIASPFEMAFAEKVISVIDPIPIYARVDVIQDNEGKLAVSELELIEPELWLRFHPPAAEVMAQSLYDILR
jgi:glutathione synthase/RimK-type ligase-like ATP-grasp enzyme